MAANFEDEIISQFGNLEYNRFKVNFSKQHIFVCGGIVDVSSQIPPSFRDRFIQHATSYNEKILNSIILAESFKDYFKENNYNVLLVFEDEIANLASLVLIFLESPGSLVELGMFCSRQSLYKKLLIVAPQEKTESEDSFIYLGPLEHIKRKEISSVVVYPWPKNDVVSYSKDYLDDLLDHISEKLSSVSKTSSFNPENSGHVALLIYEIIRLSYPILMGEIELALTALNLNVDEAEVKRHLYLLSKLRMINHNFYSSYRYYYPLFKDLKTVSFGKSKNNQVSDAMSIQMSINQSYIMEEGIQERKRRAARKQIIEKLQEDSK